MAFTTDTKQADADGYATGLAWRDNTTPVVVATGLPVDGGGRKYTVAAWSPRYVDFPGLLASLNDAEAAAGTPDTDRWGGNLTSGIIGSPQGHGSRLSPETILGMLVTRHLRG